MRRSEADRRGLKPLATIVGHATYANTPALFPTAPIGAIRRLMERTGWAIDEVDLFEINEAFAVVAMAAMRDLGLASRKGQRPRRRMRSRPSHRRLRRAHSCHAACGTRQNTDCGAESPRSASAAEKRRQWRLSGLAKQKASVSLRLDSFELYENHSNFRRSRA